MKAFEIFWIFLKLGLTSFGGPVAHLAYFRHAFVEKRKWFSEAQYAYLLTICQTIPGPASSQVGFAIGLLRGGWLGAISAFIAFTLPSVVLLLVFANSLSLLDSSIGKASLHGLGILAFIVVMQAVIGMSKQLLILPVSWIIATVMFGLVLLTNALMWQILGILICAIVSSVLAKGDSHDKQSPTSVLPVFSSFPHQFSLKTTWIAGGLFIGLFIILIGNPFNVSQYLYAQAPAYYASGSMVFGGGHVVLPFLEQTTVAQGLVTEDVFLAGYGATQAVPGPMFSFAAYLGYMGELHHQLFTPGDPNFIRSLIGAFFATLFVFLPGFLLVSAILPISQKLFVYPKVRRAFLGANAAVVGLLAATLYDPIFTHAIQSNHDLVIAGIGFVALTRFKVPVLAIVCFCVACKVLAAQFLT
ncbi:MAG: chromate transporter [Alphaproteobacteria bacterium]|jgi:chromate transporter